MEKKEHSQHCYATGSRQHSTLVVVCTDTAGLVPSYIKELNLQQHAILNLHTMAEVPDATFGHVTVLTS